MKAWFLDKAQNDEAVEYLVSHQIASGLSYGVFDKEYKFNRPQSAPSGGALCWDAEEEQDGNVVPFPDVKQALTQIYIHLQ
ncbi:hypothetical protein P175DRAFT_0557294 [Aspergillus ochraceoroseus IBT 24754]|uniref:Uncharacterized protein n=1 Tax=Aspergillus ochraceoroseus IBT 24754 TaxID=1392256 RepID=A0A2T5LWE9_9EURO|nr:uncharacterized protein P175DRAFT_0557294 [Aspergillus ochraceoroseus IBT 24754]PTU20609.1 hypothetical protein P175DRAFT_0557294 [Aspergillus ochraceoroseus IBT 24754]